MRIEPPRFDDHSLLRRLILEAFAWQGELPTSEAPSAGVDLPTLVEGIHARGTQLSGVSSTELSKVRQDQVREELFAMPNVRALDANTPRERFCLLSA